MSVAFVDMKWMWSLIVFAALIAGCTDTSGDEPPETTTPTTVATTAPATSTTLPTTTTAAATTTSAATTTTTATTTTRYEAGTPTLFPLESLPGSGGAAGSGCSPGSEALPDGAWFGYVVARDGSTVDFDLACLYFGDIAYEKGAEAGEEVANDYFLSNVNPSLRSITITGEVPVFEIDATQPDVFLTVPFADWPIDPNLYVACPDPFCGVWLYVNDGSVTEMVEQYFP
jgi:hypothetical protein